MHARKYRQQTQLSQWPKRKNKSGRCVSHADHLRYARCVAYAVYFALDKDSALVGNALVVLDPQKLLYGRSGYY